MTAGGGLDLKVSHHFAIRIIQAEYLMTGFEPRSSLTDGVGSGADLLALCLNQVYVFGVAKRLLEGQFGDGGAAAKRDLARQRWRVEQVAQRATDN